MTDIIKDMSTLTTISEKSLHELMKKEEYCIVSAIFENMKNNEVLTELDIGIGKLLVKIENNSIKYKFIPSESLEHAIVNSYKHDKCVLVDKLNKSLVERITNTYKDIL